MDTLRRMREILEKPLLSFQNVELSLLLVIEVALILVVTSICSRLVKRFLRKNVFARTQISQGAQASITRVLHYLIMILGGLVAIEHIGIDLTALAALSAVLMVGIGFGLQNITSNFISGLILLFERPIQVGDFVEVQGTLGRVKAINARSTTIDTQDNVSIIVPNSSFIAESVTNWSYRDVKTRIHVPVGVAYGSDVELVEKTLLEVGAAHAEVLSDPLPKVQFLEFGDSSLNFDLLVWIQEPTRQFFIRSDLNFAIDRAFREHNIQIPFPQRDLHIRSAVAVPIDENNGG